MVGEIEGLGDVVTGGIVARAVEPDAGEGGGAGTVCLNCRAALVGEYCHACGQKAHVHRTLRAFGHDLAHSVLHFDGKFWRTVPLLAWRPGELTRRYVEGERASFVSPLAIFLFSVFLMFAAFGTIGGPIMSNADLEATQEIGNERQVAEKRLADLNRRKGDRLSKHRDTTEVDSQIAEARAQVAALAATTQGKSEAAGLQMDGMPEGGNEWFNETYRKAKENPSLLAYKLQANAYKFSWALIPISVPFVWLLFPFRRRYKAYDHSVFVTYSLAFMTLLVVALSVARTIGIAQAWIILTLAFFPPLHMYRQLKGAYRLSRFGAAWRTLTLAIFALIAGGLFFGLLVALGSH